MNEQEIKESINQKAHKIHELRAEIKVLNNVKRELKTPKTKDGVWVEMPEIDNAVFIVREHGLCKHLKFYTCYALEALFKLGLLFSTREACELHIKRLKFWHDMLKQDGASVEFVEGKEQYVLCFDDRLTVNEGGCLSSYANRIYFKTEKDCFFAIQFANTKYTQEQLETIFMGGE